MSTGPDGFGSPLFCPQLSLSHQTLVMSPALLTCGAPSARFEAMRGTSMVKAERCRLMASMAAATTAATTCQGCLTVPACNREGQSEGWA